MFLVGTLSRCTSFSISCMSFPLSPHIEVSAAEDVQRGFKENMVFVLSPQNEMPESTPDASLWSLEG